MPSSRAGGETQVGHLVVLQVHLVGVELAQQQRAVLLDPDREVRGLAARGPRHPSRPAVPHPLRTPSRTVHGHRDGQQPRVALGQARGSGEPGRELQRLDGTHPEGAHRDGAHAVKTRCGASWSQPIHLCCSDGSRWDGAMTTVVDLFPPLGLHVVAGPLELRGLTDELDRRAVRPRRGRHPRARRDAVLLPVDRGAGRSALAQHRRLPLGQALDLLARRLLPRPRRAPRRAGDRLPGRRRAALPGHPHRRDRVVARARVPGPRARHGDASRDVRAALRPPRLRGDHLRGLPRQPGVARASRARSATGPRRSAGSSDARASSRSTRASC